MGAYCILCGKRNKTVSYHRFPKDSKCRQQWLSFCGIREEDLNTVTHLCSDHFKEEDLRKKLNCVIIEPGAIPTIKSTKKKKRSNSRDIECQLPLKKNNFDDTAESATTSGNSQKVLSIAENDIPVEDSETVVSIAESGTSLHNPPTAATTTSTLIEVNTKTPPRTIPDPRYIGDIQTPHLSTPRRAKQAIELTRRVISQHTRTIKTLQQARNRLRSRIKNIKDLLKELHRKNLISESAYDNLMVSVHGKIDHCNLPLETQTDRSILVPLRLLILRL